MLVDILKDNLKIRSATTGRADFQQLIHTLKGHRLINGSIEKAQPALEIAVKLVDGTFHLGIGGCHHSIGNRAGGVHHKQNVADLITFAPFVEIRQKKRRVRKPSIRRGKGIVIDLQLDKLIENGSPVGLGLLQFIQHPLSECWQQPSRVRGIPNLDSLAGFRQLLDPHIPQGIVLLQHPPR